MGAVGGNSFFPGEHAMRRCIQAAHVSLRRLEPKNIRRTSSAVAKEGVRCSTQPPMPIRQEVHQLHRSLSGEGGQDSLRLSKPQRPCRRVRWGATLKMERMGRLESLLHVRRWSIGVHRRCTRLCATKLAIRRSCRKLRKPDSGTRRGRRFCDSGRARTEHNPGLALWSRRRWPEPWTLTPTNRRCGRPQHIPM